jgi:hypothetical protein
VNNFFILSCLNSSKASFLAHMPDRLYRGAGDHFAAAAIGRDGPTLGQGVNGIASA